MKILGSGTSWPTKIGCGLMKRLAESSIFSVIIVITEILAVIMVVSITIMPLIAVRDITRLHAPVAVKIGI